MNKQEIKEREKLLIEMTRKFCSEKLNEEYAQLTEKLIKKMGRKRDVPFKRGRPEIWAAAVVYAIGSINFLFDDSFEPYIPSKEIFDYFGTKPTTTTNKAGQIRKMLKLSLFDPDFSTQLTKDNDPFNDFVVVDGFIVPLSTLPEQLQEMVRRERAAGRDVEFWTETED